MAASGLVIVSIVLLMVCGVGANPKGFNNQPHQQELGRPAVSGQLISYTWKSDEGKQQVVVIDAAREAMTVYHIDPHNGEISLTSVRNFRWDLMMEDFNGVAPLPGDIRTLIEK